MSGLSNVLITQLVTVVTGLSATSDTSQGSVTTPMRCDGTFSVNVTTHFLLIPLVKNFENRLIFDKVIGTYKFFAIFGPPCRVENSCNALNKNASIYNGALQVAQHVSQTTKQNH